MSSITLSEKILAINNLPETDTFDIVKKEIEALENFTNDELGSIFGNPSIVWILKNYTIKTLKDKAGQALTKPEVKVGDMVHIGSDVFGQAHAVVLEIVGKDLDRLTIMYNNDEHYVIREGVSIYDVRVLDKNHDIIGMLRDLQ